jgi:hypothetical protein
MYIYYMTDDFNLIVEYKGEVKGFPAQLVIQGYTHKFKVVVDGIEIFFEPDEEGSYRAVKMPWQDQKQLEKVNRDLLKAIQEKIVAILA